MVDPRLDDHRADGVENHNGVRAAGRDVCDEIVARVPEREVVPVASIIVDSDLEGGN